MEKKIHDNYQQIIMTFSEPKLTNRKAIKNISFTTFYVIMTFITLISMTYLGYFNFISANKAPIFIKGLEAKTVFYTALALTVCFAFFVVKPHIVNRALFFWIPFVIISFIGVYLSTYWQQNAYLFLAALIILAVGTGFIVSAALLAYIFTLSSPERLLATIFLMVGIVIYFYFQRMVITLFSQSSEFYLPLVILVILYISIFFVDSSDFSKIEIKNEKINYVSLIVMIVYVSFVIMNEAINSAIKENITNQYYLFSEAAFFIGALFSLILGAILLTKLRYGLIICGIIWLFLVLATQQSGIAFVIFDNNIIYLRILEIVMGMNSCMGMMTAIIMVGKVFEDKSNYKILRIVIIFIAAALVSSRFLSLGLQGSPLLVIYTVMEVFSFWGVVILVGFTIFAFMKMMAQQVSKPQYMAFNSSDEPFQNPLEVLTAKEMQIFDLLICGSTLRQIAGELKMKYDAVNFHYKNIYRKLEVNSKVELIVRYGKR